MGLLMSVNYNVIYIWMAEFLTEDNVAYGGTFLMALSGSYLSGLTFYFS